MVDSGVFGTVRHPLYLGTAVTAAGFVLMSQSIPLLIIGALAVFCCVMASKREDAFNTAKFGDAYREYMRQVPMWNIFKGLRRR